MDQGSKEPGLAGDDFEEFEEGAEADDFGAFDEGGDMAASISSPKTKVQQPVSHRNLVSLALVCPHRNPVTTCSA